MGWSLPHRVCTVNSWLMCSKAGGRGSRTVLPANPCPGTLPPGVHSPHVGPAAPKRHRAARPGTAAGSKGDPGPMAPLHRCRQGCRQGAGSGRRTGSLCMTLAPPFCGSSLGKRLTGGLLPSFGVPHSHRRGVAAPQALLLVSWSFFLAACELLPDFGLVWLCRLPQGPWLREQSRIPRP